ncbi:uncharacterized protein [Salminus brasiliensis]|uniref:uncharacterized protein isoform X2 n=1 Tax=Salminus brasiliensis TaxID=930266 RepID=UPI003B832B3E
MDTDEDLEALGEKLYDLIRPKHADMAPKLTGMLLELPGAVVGQMLQDEELLAEALDRALAALQPDDSKPPSRADDADSASSDSLGERLHDLVELHNTGQTQKITGMLLEQKKEAVLQLLSDPTLLEEKVQTALKTLQDCGQVRQETDVSDSSDRDEAEEIGETLFRLVQDMEPVHCADVTGMLLEMDPQTLQQIVSDRAMLEVAVQRAKSALEGALSPPQQRKD